MTIEPPEGDADRVRSRSQVRRRRGLEARGGGAVLRGGSVDRVGEREVLVAELEVGGDGHERAALLDLLEVHAEPPREAREVRGRLRDDLGGGEAARVAGEVAVEGELACDGAEQRVGAVGL